MKQILVIGLLLSLSFAGDSLRVQEPLFKLQLQTKLKELTQAEKEAIREQIQTLREKRDSSVHLENNSSEKLPNPENLLKDRQLEKQQILKMREVELRERLKKFQEQKQQDRLFMKNLKGMNPEKRQEILHQLTPEEQIKFKELLPPSRPIPAP